MYCHLKHQYWALNNKISINYQIKTELWSTIQILRDVVGQQHAVQNLKLFVQIINFHWLLSSALRYRILVPAELKSSLCLYTGVMA